MLIGVTGNIASGKSTLSSALSEKLSGILIDADKVAHSLYDEKPELTELLAREFGSGILINGKLNRSRLGEIVFSDAEQLHRLNILVHPYLINKLNGVLVEASTHNPFVILDAALIFEWQIHTELDRVIQVRASQDIRLARLMKRNHLTQSEALLRIRSQKKDEEKWVPGTIIIYNNGSPDDLEDQIDNLIAEIKKF